MVVANVDDRAGVRWRVAEEIPAGIEPLRHDREILVEDASGSREDARAARRFERVAGEKVAEGAGGNGRVVVIRPERRNPCGRSDDPSDAQPR